MSTSAPLGLHLSAALGRSEPLEGLLKRAHESRRRLAALADLLPGGLGVGVRAGPLDEESWVLLVDNAAMAAKLRQLLPALTAQLQACGWHQPPIKIKVLPKG